MSDPQTSLDIEDVLSSIRRLVSEHPPLVARRTTRPRLILTPDIRVDVGVAAPKPKPAPEPEPMREPAAAIAPGDDCAKAEPAALREAGAPARPAGGPDPTLEERIAELEHAIAATAEVWEADTGDDGFDGFDAPEADAVAALAAARRAGAEAPAGGPASDVAAPEAMPEPVNVAANLSGDDAAGRLLLDDDEAVLDEEMLRDLVAEFVRQELQGALGERITRNVRKLVRAEIQRALAAREFD